jgi:hypothetical protein
VREPGAVPREGKRKRRAGELEKRLRDAADDAETPYSPSGCLDRVTTLHVWLERSKLLVPEKCGHFPWLEQAEVFEAQLPRFLKALGVCELRASERPSIAASFTDQQATETLKHGIVLQWPVPRARRRPRPVNDS